MKKIILVFLFMMISCGYYSFKGSLPPDVKTIAITVFNDRTSYPNIREILTNSLTNAFIFDNTLRVVDESQADLVISGTIQSIRQTAANVAKGEIVNEYKVTVSVKVKCVNTKTSKILYDKTFSNYGTMEGAGTPDAYEQAILAALSQNTNDIVNATLAAW
jgi:ABC-type uncharacterized transport system auxiliary subunit